MNMMEEVRISTSFTTNSDGKLRIGRVHGHNGISEGCTLNFLCGLIHQTETSAFLNAQRSKYELGTSLSYSSRSVEAAPWDESSWDGPSETEWDDVPEFPVPGSFSPAYTPGTSYYTASDASTYEVKSPANKRGSPAVALHGSFSPVYRPGLSVEETAYSPSNPGYYGDYGQGPSSPRYAPGTPSFPSPRWSSPPASPEYSPTSPLYRYSPSSPRYSPDAGYNDRAAYSPRNSSPSYNGSTFLSWYSPTSPKYSPTPPNSHEPRRCYSPTSPAYSPQQPH